MKLFDAHCHLQDPRILNKAPQLIQQSLDAGVVRFAVNGVCEADWGHVKRMGEQNSCVVPCFGVHPCFVSERTPNWFQTLKGCFESTPSAAVGEIGLDKGSRGRNIDFSDQIDVFRQQLELAKELKRPVSIHCVRAFGDLLLIMKSVGPFSAGVILHSYLGSAEMVPEFASLGSYFSFSGYLMGMKAQKAKKMLKAVPSDRILLESDAPDALPKPDTGSLFLVEEDPSIPKEIMTQVGDSVSDGRIFAKSISTAEVDASALPKEMLNHPANIHKVLNYVASMLEIEREELADLSYKNAVNLFSYEGSKVVQQE